MPRMARAGWWKSGLAIVVAVITLVSDWSLADRAAPRGGSEGGADGFFELLVEEPGMPLAGYVEHDCLAWTAAGRWTGRGGAVEGGADGFLPIGLGVVPRGWGGMPECDDAGPAVMEADAGSQGLVLLASPVEPVDEAVLPDRVTAESAMPPVEVVSGAIDSGTGLDGPDGGEVVVGRPVGGGRVAWTGWPVTPFVPSAPPVEPPRSDPTAPPGMPPPVLSEAPPGLLGDPETDPDDPVQPVTTTVGQRVAVIVAEPGMMLLLGLAMIGLGLVRRFWRA